MGERGVQTFPGVVEIGRYSDEAGHEFSLVIDRRSSEAPIVFECAFEGPSLQSRKRCKPPHPKLRHGSGNRKGQ